MFKHMIRWIVVLATLLIIATALVLGPSLNSNAAGVHHTTKTTTTSATPTTPVMTPDMFRHG